MTRPTIIRAAIPPMAGDAPAHAQRLHLADLLHVLHLAVADRAIEAPFDVALMREIDMGRQIVHFVPGHRLSIGPIFGQFDDLGPIGRYIFMAFHAHGNGGNAWFGGLLNVGMAMGALQSHKGNMPLVTERNGLVGRLAIRLPEIAQ